MGGIVCQQVLARYPQTAGCVVVDCVAQHHALDTYLPVMRWLLRRHPRTALAAMVNAAALFGSDALVRELLLGEDAGDDVVAALRPHLGGETAVAIPVMLAAKLRGQQPLDGQKLLFLSAQRSAFYPTSLVEVSAREYGTRCVLVDGPHNLMLLPQSALLAAQAIEAFLVTLRTDPSALFASPRRAREYLFDAQTPEETVTWYLAQAWCHDSGLAMADMMAAKSQPLRTQRMLFLAGRQDASLSLRAIRASAAFLHAPLVELDRPHDGMLAGDWQGAADAVWACVQQISAEVRNP
jgi:hypothetical protein